MELCYSEGKKIYYGFFFFMFPGNKIFFGNLFQKEKKKVYILEGKKKKPEFCCVAEKRVLEKERFTLI